MQRPGAGVTCCSAAVLQDQCCPATARCSGRIFRYLPQGRRYLALRRHNVIYLAMRDYQLSTWISAAAMDALVNLPGAFPSSRLHNNRYVCRLGKTHNNSLFSRGSLHYVGKFIITSVLYSLKCMQHIYSPPSSSISPSSSRSCDGAAGLGSQ